MRMVLKFEGKLISSLPRTINELLNSFPNIQSLATNFLKQNVISVKPKSSLYVGQGEYAVIPAEDKFIKIIGSDEATTCHVLILKHPSGTVAVTHFDGNKYENKVFSDIINEIKRIEGSVSSLEGYVVGGYKCNLETEKKNISETLSVKILKLFFEHCCTIDLRLWCTCELNTKFIDNCSYPFFTGLAIDREISTIFPASFEYQIPNYILRSASNWVDPYKIPRNLYNPLTKCVSINPFFDWNPRYFQQCSQLSDEDILKYFSTSPNVEPPTFCMRLRNVFLLLANNTTETLFANLIPKTYLMNPEGEWIG